MRRTARRFGHNYGICEGERLRDKAFLDVVEDIIVTKILPRVGVPQGTINRCPRLHELSYLMVVTEAVLAILFLSRRQKFSETHLELVVQG